MFPSNTSVQEKDAILIESLIRENQSAAEGTSLSSRGVQEEFKRKRSRGVQEAKKAINNQQKE